MMLHSDDDLLLAKIVLDGSERLCADSSACFPDCSSKPIASSPCQDSILVAFVRIYVMEDLPDRGGKRPGSLSRQQA